MLKKTQEAHAAKKTLLKTLALPISDTHGLPLNHYINLGCSWPQCKVRVSILCWHGYPSKQLGHTSIRPFNIYENIKSALLAMLWALADGPAACQIDEYNYRSKL